jgi:hypothetical protein
MHAMPCPALTASNIPIPLGIRNDEHRSFLNTCLLAPWPRPSYPNLAVVLGYTLPIAPFTLLVTAIERSRPLVLPFQTRIDQRRRHTDLAHLSARIPTRMAHRIRVSLVCSDPADR